MHTSEQNNLLGESLVAHLKLWSLISTVSHTADYVEEAVLWDIIPSAIIVIQNAVDYSVSCKLGPRM